MELGVSFGHSVSPIEIIRASRSLDNRASIERMWVSESTGFDAFTTLGAVTVQTNRLKLATGIVNVFSRTPTQIAMASATLQQLSSGRFDLGMGASSQRVVAGWHEIDYSRPRSRVEDSIDKIRSKYANLFNEQRPLKIYVAAVGDRMLELAKKKAEGTLCFLRPFSRIKEDTESLGPSSFEIHASVVTCVGENSSFAEAQVRKTIAFYLAYGIAYRRFLISNHADLLNEESAAAIERAWQAGKRSEASGLVPKELIQEVSIFGTQVECRAQIEHYRSLRGLTSLALQFNPGSKDLETAIQLISGI